MAVSDEGRWLVARLQHDDHGRLTGLTDAVLRTAPRIETVLGTVAVLRTGCRTLWDWVVLEWWTCW